MRRQSLSLALTGACLLFVSCGRKGAVVIGSKNFTEQVILGEIAAQQIERKLHIPVERKLNLGGTLLTHEALLNGQIDLYPEYTGTASSSVLKQKVPSDPAGAYLQVKTEYLKRFNLIWLPPLGFNDTFAMVVRKGDGRELNPPALSTATKRDWRLGVGYEFLTRPDGLKSLDDKYQFRWKGTPKTMDLGLLYQALSQNQVDMAAGNSTDGVLSGGRFAVLQDDRGAFPPYSACYVVRHGAVEEHPSLVTALSMLSNQISEKTMQHLNSQVDIEHKPVVRVVSEFMATMP